MSAPRPAVYSRQNSLGPKALLRDLAEGLAMGDVWRAFAWDEMEQRYRRSALGLAWIVISYLLFVAGLSLFFGGFATVGARHFIIYVSLGYAAFIFLIGNVVDGCDVFRAASHWIKSAPLPYSIYIYKSIFRSLFPFAIHIVCALLIMAFLGWRLDWGALMALPALALYVVNAVWVQLLFGLFAARWRDIAHLTNAVTRLMFFLSPIMWVYEERTGFVRLVADANPLTHFVEIFRAPIMGEPTNPLSWPYALAFTAVCMLAAVLAGSIMRRRLPFWV